MSKKDKHTLIVIDMQPTMFPLGPNGPNVTAACQKAIKFAMDNKNPIIFVEWKYSYGDNHLPTTVELTGLTDGYARAYTVYKDQRDGSDPIAKLITKKRLPKKHIKVCGAYTTQCVYSTVKGLREKTNSILHLLENAVDSYQLKAWDHNLFTDLKDCVIAQA